MRQTATWVKDDPLGVESVSIEFPGDRMMASGVAMGTDPEPYRLEYDLETGANYVTRRFTVTSHGRAWRRSLELIRCDEGVWSARVSSDGDVALPPPGGDLAGFEAALDVDLGLSPATNTMPVLRHRLIHGGESGQLVMTWVSVPDLAIHHSEQSYVFQGRTDSGHSIVRFTGSGPWGVGFTADLTFDSHGLISEYSELARRVF